MTENVVPTLSRAVKGAVVTLLSVWIASLILSWGFDMAEARQDESPDAAFAGAVEVIVCYVVSVIAMPLTSWTCFRLLKVSRISLLVTLGAVAWALVGGYSFDELDKDNGHISAAIFAGFIVLGAFVAWQTSPSKKGVVGPEGGKKS